MALIKCLDCGGKVSDRATLCPHCGCPVKDSLPQTKTCPECGQEVDVSERKCPNCAFPFSRIKGADKSAFMGQKAYNPVQPNKSHNSKYSNIYKHYQIEYMTCKVCGTVIRKGLSRCPACGSIICRLCGTKVAFHHNCPNCGSQNVNYKGYNIFKGNNNSLMMFLPILAVIFLAGWFLYTEVFSDFNDYYTSTNTNEFLEKDVPKWGKCSSCGKQCSPNGQAIRKKTGDVYKDTYTECASCKIEYWDRSDEKFWYDAIKNARNKWVDEHPTEAKRRGFDKIY